MTSAPEGATSSDAPAAINADRGARWIEGASNRGRSISKDLRRTISGERGDEATKRLVHHEVPGGR